MPFSNIITGKYGTATIEHATPDDLDSILGLFDGAVAWLVAQGITGQWGTRPFSENSSMRARLEGWVSSNNLYVARIDAEIMACLALANNIPLYALNTLPAFPDPAFYLEAFVTSRALAGTGLGGDFMHWAEDFAAEQGKPSMWLDCWADNPGLVGYYTQQGYIPLRDFYVGSWRGMLFHKALLLQNGPTQAS